MVTQLPLNKNEMKDWQITSFTNLTRMDLFCVNPSDPKPTSSNLHELVFKSIDHNFNSRHELCLSKSRYPFELPYSIISLSLCDVKLDECSEYSEIKLPAGLVRLKITGVYSDIKFVETSNISRLTELTNVDFTLYGGGYDEELEKDLVVTHTQALSHLSTLFQQA
ncbi:unnamed protein product [Ambrosiozyma monospora]|uniref:Unnamed protein product n=1 Tax=Ambrosiozyma monospora TaxID=43982 RepID=A0ACB5TJD6_AMBMO|nr:unnamed protein product [Ambrosiozyma monospora]